MNIEHMIDEVVDACRREFRGLVEDVMSLGLKGVSGMEAAVMEQALHFGSRVVSKLLQGMTCNESAQATCPHCAEPASARGRRARSARTLLGDIRFERRVFSCPSCAILFAPIDRELGLAKAENLTAHAKNEIALLSAHTDFAAASGILGRLTGAEVSAVGVRDVAQRIGARVSAACDAEASRCRAAARASLADAPQTLVLQADGVMGRFDDGWHEAMVGVVAEIVGPDPKREGCVQLKRREVVTKVRDRELFWSCFGKAAQRHGLDSSPTVLFISDAGGGNFEAASLSAPHAVQILDFYHAAQHLDGALKAVMGSESDEAAALFETLRRRLKKKGGARAVIKRLQNLQRQCARRLSVKAAADFRREIEYFRKNEHRMRYWYFRSKGWPIGSGMVEGCCRSVFQERFKRSGMTWTKEGMQEIAALRDAALSNRWQECVTARLAA